MGYARRLTSRSTRRWEDGAPVRSAIGAFKKDMRPIEKIEEAEQLIESFEGCPEDFELPISDQLQDPVGINMAIITDSILKRGWMPDGFEQKEGYRIYHYKNAE